MLGYGLFAHMQQRIANCTRNHGPKGLKLERFREALEDDHAGKPLLLFLNVSFPFTWLSSCMDRKHYKPEAEYIRAVQGWRKACDERGLSELQQSRYNYQFLNYILNDWMPWFESNYDFSLLEVNRYAICIKRSYLLL